MNSRRRDLPKYHWTMHDWYLMHAEFKFVEDCPELSFIGPDDSIVIDEYQSNIDYNSNNKSLTDEEYFREGEEQ